MTVLNCYKCVGILDNKRKRDKINYVIKIYK